MIRNEIGLVGIVRGWHNEILHCAAVKNLWEVSLRDCKPHLWFQRVIAEKDPPRNRIIRDSVAEPILGKRTAELLLIRSDMTKDRAVATALLDLYVAPGHVHRLFDIRPDMEILRFRCVVNQNLRSVLVPSGIFFTNSQLRTGAVLLRI